MSSYTKPVFIHIYKWMGIEEPYINRNECGNIDLKWEDCNAYINLNNISWFEFTEDDDGHPAVSISSTASPDFEYLSDDVEYFKSLAISRV